MPMPKTVKIGPQVFDVVEHARGKDGMLDDDTYGYTLDKENLIVIDSTLHKTKKQVTLLHEVMHAARFVFDNPAKPGKNADYDAWEHHFIGVWENSLLMILRDNPELVVWLRDE